MHRLGQEAIRNGSIPRWRRPSQRHHRRSSSRRAPPVPNPSPRHRSIVALAHPTDHTIDILVRDNDHSPMIAAHHAGEGNRSPLPPASCRTVSNIPQTATQPLGCVRQACWRQCGDDSEARCIGRRGCPPTSHGPSPKDIRHKTEGQLSATISERDL